MLFIPHKLKDKIFGFYDSFVHGLKILENKTQTVWIMALSLVIWILAGVEIYLLGFSFHIQLPFGWRLSGCCLYSTGNCFATGARVHWRVPFAVLKALDIFGVQSQCSTKLRNCLMGNWHNTLNDYGLFIPLERRNCLP